MKASIGRTVIVKGGLAYSNGNDVAPAIITKVWNQNNPDTLNGPVCVNLTMFPDCAPPLPVSSVNLFETEQEAQGQYMAAFWPPRV